jgi:hypothetical protein
MQPVLPGDSERSPRSKIEGVPPGYVYIHTPLPSTQFLNLNAYAKDRKRNDDFIPDLLTDIGLSTWLVHSLRRGNAANILIGDQTSLLSESPSEDEN